VKPVASRKQKLERETEQIAEPEGAEEKPAVEPTGLMPVSGATAVISCSEIVAIVGEARGLAA
jgi:hypothetical protein